MGLGSLREKGGEKNDAARPQFCTKKRGPRCIKPPRPPGFRSFAVFWGGAGFLVDHKGRASCFCGSEIVRTTSNFGGSAVGGGRWGLNFGSQSSSAGSPGVELGAPIAYGSLNTPADFSGPAENSPRAMAGTNPQVP